MVDEFLHRSRWRALHGVWDVMDPHARPVVGPLPPTRFPVRPARPLPLMYTCSRACAPQRTSRPFHACLRLLRPGLCTSHGSMGEVAASHKAALHTTSYIYCYYLLKDQRREKTSVYEGEGGHRMLSRHRGPGGRGPLVQLVAPPTLRECRTPQTTTPCKGHHALRRTMVFCLASRKSASY